MRPGNTHPSGGALRRRAGFTAIEVSAVATIIAIMALILIPIVRNRVEEARRVAAMDDMKGIETGQSLAYGYANLYFRLQDLTRPESVSTGNPVQQGIEFLKLPPATWNQPLASSQVANLAENWKGAFVAYHNTRSVRELVALFPFLFRSPNNDAVAGTGAGPILVQGRDDEDWLGATGGLDRALYPIDPWGNPYIFFGPGAIGVIGNPAVDAANQQNYSNAVVFSMGPDGVPASNQAAFGNAVNYFRETGLLGAVGSDDLKREF